MLAAILPITNDIVAAIAPIAEKYFIAINNATMIVMNSMAVPYVMGFVFLMLTRAPLWKHMKTVSAGKNDMIIKGSAARSASIPDKPETLINHISANGVKAIIINNPARIAARFTANFLSGMYPSFLSPSKATTTS